MANSKIDISEFHWLMGMLHSIDVGVIVLDKDYNVKVWNDFMANHSGVLAHDIVDKNIFHILQEIPQDWFKRKSESVFLLNSRSFTTWEQRPYLFRFKNYRPLTGPAEYMYQNVTFIPLTSTDGKVDHIGIIIYDVTDIAVSNIELEKANNKLETLSRTDHLSKLHNRRYWEEQLEKEYFRARRTGDSCCLLMFDIDHFKEVNDEYGHQAGDECIRAAAKVVLSRLRNTDIAGRYGGEEFGVVLVDTSAESASILGERLRKSTEDIVVNYDGRDIQFTISLGIAELTSRMTSYQQWLEAADNALYDAKAMGRNRVEIFNDY